VDDLISDFIAETREGIEALDSELVRFEQCPDDPELLSGIFRLIHTIKGTCGFLGLSRLQTVAHAAENVLGGFRDGTLLVTKTAVSAVLDTVDLIRWLTEALATSGAEPEGDDSVLIRRLEAVLEGEAEAPVLDEETQGMAPVAELPASVTDTRSLIDRLGGDATIDAAAEMALAHVQGGEALGPLFADADPDRLQAAIRDSLCDLARKPQQASRFANLLGATAAFAPDPTALATVFEAVARALVELDVQDAAVEELRHLALAQTDTAKAPEALEPAAPAEILSEVACAEPLKPIPSAAAPPVATPSPPPAAAPAVAQVEVPAPAPPKPAPMKAEGAPATPSGDASGPAQTIRVSVDALEHLMTVVSELVLIRNQLIQTLRLEPESPFAAPLNRLNQVTSELQEGVMTTRMQPISGAWANTEARQRGVSRANTCGASSTR
jgi:two-component system chemotaxis sensor kinase CheA